MQIPFLDATKDNPELSKKPKAGIWIAYDFAGRNADEDVSCVGLCLHTC